MTLNSLHRMRSLQNSIAEFTINSLWPVANPQYGIVQEIRWAVEDISLRICVDTDVVLSTTVGWWELTRLGTIVGPPCIKKLQSKWCRCSILNSCVQGQAHGLPKIVVILPVLLTGPLSEYSMALTLEWTRRPTATSPNICLFMAISVKSSKCFDDVMTKSLKSCFIFRRISYLRSNDCKIDKALFA